MAIIVFAGQSNTGGTYMTPSTLVAPWTPSPLTLIWDAAAKTWAPLEPGRNAGYGTMLDAWGPEVQFARAFRAAYPGEILYIVKSAEGGTALQRDDEPWHYDWSPQSDAELFDRAGGLITAAAQSLGGVRPDAVFWGQGEEDGSHAPAAASYGGNLQAFFAAVRAEWMGREDGKIGFFRLNTTTKYSADVRSGQAAVDAADGNATSFATDGYPMQGDGVHFTAAGYDQVGQGYFDLYTSWRGGSAPGSAEGRIITSRGPGDALTGGAGGDTLNASQGGDVLTGGGGRDAFTWAREPWAPARVTDFKLGEDRLDITALLRAVGYTGDNPVRDGYLWLIDGAGGARVLLDPDGPGAAWPNFIVELSGLSASALSWGQLAGSSAGADPVVATAEANILRSGAAGPYTTVAQIVSAADATTSVATLSYQFFTGKIPGQPGIDYLVSPTGPNPNNLNSAYYQSFNLENRYINFAVNLGREGEGKTQFQAEYGNLTLTQATKLAYGEIFGTTPTDAKVSALLSGGRDLYFQAYGQDGPNGQGTKAAMVGWLLAEAEKAVGSPGTELEFAL